MRPLKEDVSHSMLGGEPPGMVPTFRFQFRAELPVFSGHFPGHPVVPGIYLIEAVRTACERSLRQDLLFTSIDDVKFTMEVVPGDVVETQISLARVEETWLCHATVRTSRGKAGRFRLTLSENCL